MGAFQRKRGGVEMRKHLYRKSAWKEGVPRSLNYRSVLSGALYGSRRVGGLTAHSSLRRPSRHRLRWSFLTFPSPGRPRGRRAPPLRDLPRRPPAPVPVAAGLQAGGASLPWAAGPCPGAAAAPAVPAGSRWRGGGEAAMGNGRKHRAAKQANAPLPCRPPATSRDPQKALLAGLGTGALSTVPPRHRPGCRDGCANGPPRGLPPPVAAGAARDAADSVPSVEGKRGRNE